MPPNIIRSPVLVLHTLGCFGFHFLFCSLCWILPSVNSAVGSPFSHFFNFLTSWQRPVNCLWEPFLLPGHFPSLPCDWPVEILWTDPKYVLCPPFSPFHPLPLPFLIQRLDADNHDNFKSQVLNIAGPQNRRILDPCTNTWVGGGASCCSRTSVFYFRWVRN